MRQKLILTLTFLGAVTLAIFAQDIPAPELRSANDAWAAGNYIAALNTYVKLLNAPDGEKYLDAIALQTGELYVTEELTTDGRNPRMSADGRFMSYETGPVKTPVTRIFRTEGKHELVAEFPGTNAVISANSSKVAYIRIPATDELSKAQEAVDKNTEAGAERTFAQQTLAHLQAKTSTIVMRDLATQKETELKTGALLKQPSMVFGADNETVFFVGAPEGDTKRCDVYAVTSSSEPVVVTDADGFKAAPIASASGKALIVSLPNATPFPVPQPPAAEGGVQGQRGQRGQRGAGSAVGGGRGGAPQKFGIVDLSTHRLSTISGTAPVFSDDGNSLAYLTTSGNESSLLVRPLLGGDPVVALKTTDKLAAPAFSPDGKRVVYQKMNRDDWEIYYVNVDGKNETRVTRDIQHDVVPRFLTNDRIIAASGEPRDRTSYIYDLPSMKQTRLFHNNTVRTINPEYSWMPTPDGTKVLISSERDGDTISPERGVYLVDLTRKVEKTDLNQRLQKDLTSETLLREFAQRIFEPIAADVRKVVDQVSTHEVYGHERSLVSFDSRHISMPGNKKAIEYITEQFKSFGYEPEQQWFEPRGALDGKSANVIARLNGTENPDLIYTVSAHLDSVVAGPGADDDGSGITAMLEAARVLRAHPMPATIIFAAFTGEESGELGSKEFARVAKEGKWKVQGSLNNDMVGYANDERLDNTIRYSNSSIRDIQHAAAIDFTRLITYDAHYYKGTDGQNLFEAFGDVIGGMGGYPVLSSPHYHTANDVETINFEQVAETSKATIATLMFMASMPAPVKDLMVKGNEVTWTASPEKGVVSYIVSHAGRDQKVTQPHVTLAGLKSGDVITVRAVNSRGMQGWDAGRVTVAK